MMQRLIVLGAVLLVVQIGLLVKFNNESTVLKASTPDTLFLALNPAEVSRIELNGMENKRVILERSEDGWILPESFSAAADSKQVEKLLEKLASVKQGLAVATTAGAPKRFKTTRDNFERHLVIKAGDSTVGDFYLGSSAGFRHSHVRKADQSEVVTLPISNFELEIEADKWLDGDLAKLNKDEIKSLELTDIILTRNDTDWSVDTLKDEQPDKEEVEKIITKVTGLAVQSVLDPQDVSSLFNGGELTQFTVTLNNDSKVTYNLAKQDDRYVLKMSNNDLYFKVNTFQAEGINEINLASLTKKNEDEEEEATTVPAQH
ncbi:MAG: DUF4340 domain-containing protein [Desulforhopalus sp.]